MTIATCGLGGSGALCTYGYGDVQEEGPVPPRPKPRVVQPAPIRGGSGSSYEEPPLNPRYEFVPATAYVPETSQKDFIDLTPIMLQELLKQGRDLQKALRDRLFDLTTKTQNLERLKAEIHSERSKMFEENAMLKAELEKKYIEMQKLYDNIIAEKNSLEAMARLTQEGVRVSYTTPKFNIDLPALGGAIELPRTANLEKFDWAKDKWLLVGACAIVGVVVAVILYAVYQEMKKKEKRKK